MSEQLPSEERSYSMAQLRAAKNQLEMDIGNLMNEFVARYGLYWPTEVSLTFERGNAIVRVKL